MRAKRIILKRRVYHRDIDKVNVHLFLLWSMVAVMFVFSLWTNMGWGWPGFLGK